MRKNLLLIFFLMLCLVTDIYAQDRKVTGTITGKDDGLPLPGVTVTAKGSKLGTTTGSSGTFTLTVPNGVTELVVSFLGYTTQTVPISPGMRVSLAVDSKELSEVVVTGVGTATDKRKIGVDVASLSAKNFAKSVATGSVEQALQGQIAGAVIRTNSGQPGEGANIILRGINSLQSSYPMILVDGVETESLNGLDPTVIDRIEVVKGAAAGMLYGAQGGNGVIQVFTKRGTRGTAPSITFSSKFSSDRILQGDDLLANNHHYVTDDEGYILDNNGVRVARGDDGKYTEPALLSGAETLNNKPYKETLYDHLDQAFKTASTFNQNLNISGGGEKSDYSINASRLDQQNVMDNKLARTTGGINLGMELFKGFTFRSTSQAIMENENLIQGNRFPLLNSYRFIDYEYRDALGNLIVQPKEENQSNSLAENDWHTRRDKSTRFVQSLNLNYKFPKFVEFDYKAGIDYTALNNLDYYKNQTSTGQDLYFGTREGSYEQSNTRTTKFNSIGSVFVRTDFQKDFNSKLPITTSTQLAYDVRKKVYNYYNGRGVGLPSYPPYNINVGATKTASSDAYETLTYGFLANQSIDYGTLLGISAGLRSDYGSEFGAGGKAFTFPRGTVYFNPSDLLKLSWLPQWKVRAALGKAGIQPKYYTRQVTLTAGSLGDGSYLTLQDVARNPNLAIQTSEEFEAGTDFVLANNNKSWLSRVAITGTYWTRKGNDIIQNADLSPSTGYIGIVDNLMSLKSSGIEISSDATMLQRKNLTWNFGIRFAHSQTTVDKIANGQDVVTGNFAQSEGQRFSIFFGQAPLSSVDQLKPDGTRYIAAADVANYELVNGFVTNKTTKQVIITGSDDKKKLGDPTPKFTMSFINSFTIFQDLSLSFQFDWTYGNTVYNLTRQWLYRDQLAADFDQPVTINGETGAFTAYYGSLYNSVNPISWFAESGSYLRLRDLSLTYNLRNALKVKWAKNISVTASARNLLTFTKYTGLDPESTSVPTDTEPLNRGVDNFGFPNLKSYQFGLNIGF
jgi:TonB-linked SusC/RagA family outer membrane protein